MFRGKAESRHRSLLFLNVSNRPRRLSTAYIYDNIRKRTEIMHREVAESHYVYIVGTKGFLQFANKLRLVRYLLSHFRTRYDDSSEL